MAARDLAASPSPSSRTAALSSSPRSALAAPPSGLAARYRSLFVIGRGGMGAVEAALEIGGDRPDRESGGEFQRVVALKRLLPDAARDARRVEMFLREAKLARVLDHPNVVRAYDYGEIDGELFLAMEYVEGQALSRVLRALVEGGGELGASLTAHVLAEVCDGLHAAHELRDEAGQPLNLVHRDVSPQNVMLAYDGHVRLLDFGVAKIEAESVTKTGEVKGKTAYMSPEQAMGDAIDRRSDLFGVGAVLFECLALRRMWGDGTDMDVIRKLALEKPPRLEDVVPSAPPELCAIYTHLVARDAKDRPASAADVARELRELVPQGREEATRALRQLLEEHFGDQAEEQRRQLTSALDEVAPEQARVLRESVSPDSLPSSSKRPPDSAPSAPAPVSARAEGVTGANPASTAGERSEGIAAASREQRRSWLWMAAAAIGVGAVIAWRVTNAAPHADPPAATGPTAPPPPATVTSDLAPAPPPPMPSAQASAVASALASALVAVPPLASAAVTAPPSQRVLAQPFTSVRPPSSVSSKPPVVPPPVSAKPPPEIDKNPF